MTPSRLLYEAFLRGRSPPAVAVLSGLHSYHGHFPRGLRERERHSWHAATNRRGGGQKSRSGEDDNNN